MNVKSITKGKLLVVRGTQGQGLTARGRIMQSPMDQIVQWTSPNKYHDIRLVHITGPMKGVVVQFSVAFARKARISNVCLCRAYPYPHQIGRGQCKRKTK